MVSRGGKAAAAPLPRPHTPTETVLKRSRGKSWRGEWPRPLHDPKARSDPLPPREATNEQPNTERLYIKKKKTLLGEERGRAAQSDVDTEAPGGWLDFHSMRPDRKSPPKNQIRASTCLQEG